jgi:DNA-binding beta-propeller fold protein YncE
MDASKSSPEKLQSERARDAAPRPDRRGLIAGTGFAATVVALAAGFALRRALLLLLALGYIAPVEAGAAPADAPLALIESIRLEGVSGRIDHMAVDLARQRLIVAELGNDTVDIIDLAAGKVLHRITGLKEPQGVGYADKADLIFVAGASDGAVRLFNGADFSAAGVIALGDDADNIRIDPKSGWVLVGYGSGGIAAIDPQLRSVVTRIPLPVHPESFQLAPDGAQLFVNLPDARQIASVKWPGGGPAERWKLAGLQGNFPLAITPDGTAIATVFRDPARLVLLDPATGSVTASMATCGDADDVFFDEARRRLYVSCGAGAVDVVRRDGTTVAELARIATSSGARTSLFVPQLDRLFVASRAGLIGGTAAILVFQPKP